MAQPLTAADREHVQAAVRDLMAEYGSQQRLAAALGVSQQAVSNGLNGRATGLGFVHAVARLRGVTAEKLLAGEQSLLARDSGGATRKLRDLPGWSEAVALARVVFPQVPDDTWTAAGALAPPAGASVARATAQVAVYAALLAQALDDAP